VTLDVVSVFMMALPGLLMAWVPMLWGGIVGQWKQVNQVLKFAFMSCCITHGVVALGGAVLATPLYFLFGPGLSELCQRTSSLQCDMMSWLYANKAGIGFILWLSVMLLVPYILLRFFHEGKRQGVATC